MLCIVRYCDSMVDVPKMQKEADVQYLNTVCVLRGAETLTHFGNKQTAVDIVRHCLQPADEARKIAFAMAKGREFKEKDILELAHNLKPAEKVDKKAILTGMDVLIHEGIMSEALGLAKILSRKEYLPKAQELFREFMEGKRIDKAAKVGEWFDIPHGEMQTEKYKSYAREFLNAPNRRKEVSKVTDYHRIVVEFGLKTEYHLS